MMVSFAANQCTGRKLEFLLLLPVRNAAGEGYPRVPQKGWMTLFPSHSRVSSSTCGQGRHDIHDK